MFNTFILIGKERVIVQSEVKNLNYGECIQITLEFFPKDAPEQYLIEHVVVQELVEYADAVTKILEESRGIKVC